MSELRCNLCENEFDERPDYAAPCVCGGRVEWLPEPGVYVDVEASKYHSCPYASNSRLGHLVPPSTPKQLEDHLVSPPKDKKVWKQGRALHTAVFEPDRYAKEYRVATQCMGTTSKRERCKASGTIPVMGGFVCGNHKDQYKFDPDTSPITQADFDMVARASRSVREHPLGAAFILAPHAYRELTLVWDQVVPALAVGQEPIVVRCKARVDWYDPDFFGGLPMDLKGVRGAHLREFQKQAFYNGYLRQSTLYRFGLRAHDLPARTFAAVAVEKEGPCDLVVYYLGDDATGPLWTPGEPAVHMSKTVLLTLRLWHECHRSNVWPGYPPEVVSMTTPEWAWSANDWHCDVLQDSIAQLTETPTP